MTREAMTYEAVDLQPDLNSTLPALVKSVRRSSSIIAIGASTGGPDAIQLLLKSLPETLPGIVIAQHIPALFIAGFAERLNRVCALTVVRAREGDQVLRGHAYIAPGDCHLLVERNGTHLRCVLSDDVPVNRHKPSVDVLFHSLAQNFGPDALGILLTGMGSDGAQGLKGMRDAGAQTIAQDKDSSVVWGMPGAAVKLGAVSDVLPLERIGRHIVRQYE